MIILRNKFLEKLFARRDYFDPKLIFKSDIKLLTKYGFPKIVFTYQEQYKKDMKNIAVDKKGISKLKKDLLAGNLYYDGPNGGDTHFLRDYSHPGKDLVFSKKINEKDRLNYRILPPGLEERMDDAGNKTYEYRQEIVLMSCLGHNIPGQGDYLKKQRIKRKNEEQI